MVCKPQVVEGSSRLQRELGTTVYSISWLTKAVKPGVLLRLGDHDGPPGLQALHVKDFRGIQGRFPGTNDALSAGCDLQRGQLQQCQDLWERRIISCLWVDMCRGCVNLRTKES